MFRRFLKFLLVLFGYRSGTEHRILWGVMRGLRFRFTDSSGFAALYSGNEKPNQRLYAQLIRPGDVVVDAGANWGVHSLYLATLVGSSGKIHAFEPHPRMVEELTWNVQRNGMAQVVVHPLGLLDQESEIPFVLGESSKSSHMASASESLSMNKVIVPCRSLDAVLEEIGIDRLRLIKVDVEGAESLALKGAERLITRFRPHLIIELHTPEQDLAVAAMLNNWGYKISRLEGPEILYLDRSWPDPNGVWGTIHAEPASVN